MKIQDSSVQLTASHEESYSRSSEISSTTSFRQIFADLAQPASDEAAEARKRVQRLLQSLIDTILAAIDGKKCKENFAAVEPLPDDPAPPTNGREISWTHHVVQKLSESERTNVCGSGCVQTTDGRQIAFDFSLHLARDEMRLSTVSQDTDAARGSHEGRRYT